MAHRLQYIGRSYEDFYINMRNMCSNIRIKEQKDYKLR